MFNSLLCILKSLSTISLLSYYDWQYKYNSYYKYIPSNILVLTANIIYVQNLLKWQLKLFALGSFPIELILCDMISFYNCLTH